MTLLRQAVSSSRARENTTRVGAGRARPLTTLHSPVGLWLLDGDLSDSSGNGLDLTLDSGTEGYAEILPGIVGAVLDGLTTLTEPTQDASLRILGDLTIELVASLNSVSGPGDVFVNHSAGATDVGSDTNNIYQLTTESASDVNLQYFSEYGSGVNITYTNAGGSYPVQPVLVQLVRSNNQVTFYTNGIQTGVASTGLAAPEDGSSGFLSISPSNQRFSGQVASLKILDTALPALSLMDEYNRTLGPVYGFQSTTSTYTLGASVDNYSPARFEFTEMARIQPLSAVSVTGFDAAGADFLSLKRIVNAGTNPLTLAHESSSSLASNRILVSGGGDLVLPTGASARIYYDSVSSRWRTI